MNETLEASHQITIPHEPQNTEKTITRFKNAVLRLIRRSETNVGENLDSTTDVQDVITEVDSNEKEEFDRTAGIRDVIPDVNPSLKVVYVVPIKGEVNNGNFFNLLKDFTTQSSGSHTLEAIFVVNNRDQDKGNAQYVENQKILDIAEYLHNGDASLVADLKEWQIKIIERVKNSKINIIALDYSTTTLGETLTGKSIEKARFIGNNLAVDRLSQATIGGEGAIVLLDADTRVGRHSTQGIIDTLVNDPSVGVLKTRYDHIPGEGGKDLYLTTAEERFSVALYRMQQFGRKASWYIIKAHEWGKHNPDWATPETRAFPASDAKMEKRNAPPSIVFFNQDRARPIGTGGQFGAVRLNSLQEGDKEAYLMHPILHITSGLFEDNRNRNSASLKDFCIAQLSLLNNCPRDLLKAVQDNTFASVEYKKSYKEFKQQNYIETKLWVDTLEHILEQMIEPVSSVEAETMKSLIQKSIHQERLRHGVTRSHIQHLVENVYPTLQEGLPMTIDTFKKLHGERETQMLSFLENNTWILDDLNSVYPGSHNAHELFEKLAQIHPDFLLTFEQTEYGMATAVCLGAANFFEMVRNNPQQYKDTATLLGL